MPAGPAPAAAISAGTVVVLKAPDPLVRGDSDRAVKRQTRALEIFTAKNDMADRNIKAQQDAEINLRLIRYKKHGTFRERSDAAGR